MLMVILAVLSAAVGIGICVAQEAFWSLAWLWMLPVSFAGSFVVLLGGAFVFLWVCCKLVDLDKPEEEFSPFYMMLIHMATDVIFPVLLTRLECRGLEQIPKQGRYVVVCNHLHDLDPAVLHHKIRSGRLAFISKKENRDMFIVGPVMHKTLCQMIDRENDREALKTILKCISLIKEDKCSIAVFPEGYCSKDGRLQHLRSGVLKIAQKAGVPIVVCTVTGTNKVFSNFLRLRPSRVTFHVLDVIAPEEHAKMKSTELGEKIFNMMLEDLGEEYRPLED